MYGVPALSHLAAPFARELDKLPLRSEQVDREACRALDLDRLLAVIRDGKRAGDGVGGREDRVAQLCHEVGLGIGHVNQKSADIVIGPPRRGKTRDSGFSSDDLVADVLERAHTMSGSMLNVNGRETKVTAPSVGPFTGDVAQHKGPSLAIGTEVHRLVTGRSWRAKVIVDQLAVGNVKAVLNTGTVERKDAIFSRPDASQKGGFASCWRA